MDDDPDSLRTYDERARATNCGNAPDGGSITRGADLFADRLGRRDQSRYRRPGSGRWRIMSGRAKEALINRAATRAVALVFANIGVDVNDPKDLQRVNDLRFGAMIRTASQKGMIAAAAAIVTGVVGAVWYPVTHLGHK
ncbi:MAG: hypothetical protein IPN66_05890 [Candidatus Competibacteraceae bacterium]|nr:hypothetical protein [Candidatus Competibacteraceae bacterium]